MESYFVFLLLGLAVGALGAFLFLHLKNQQNIRQVTTHFREKEKQLEKENLEKEKTTMAWKERYFAREEETTRQKKELEILRKETNQLTGLLEKSKTERLHLQEKLENQKSQIQEIQEKFITEFENIAGKILKTNSAEFTAANRKNLGEVLAPLKEKLQHFEKKVEDTYHKGLKDQTDLRAELKKLYELNARISEEAGNLTKALKGDVKKQGSWGEMVLERILERSGLNEGFRGYQKQWSDTSDKGRRIQPDIIINLPDNKHIIIDSKVSLVAYERTVNAPTTEDHTRHIKEHLLSLKTHVKTLSEKHYQSAQKLNSPDFVLLFIPVEASFSLAIREDQELFSYAWDQKVVIVSPSTLLATLRTIASIWQQENQTRNAIEIARQGGALYDKFVGFVKDMEKIGNNLQITQNSYSDAMGKLSEGRGNLIRSTEKLRELGARASKKIPEKLQG